MFDDELTQKIGKTTAKPPNKVGSAAFNWKSLSLEDLIRNYDEIRDNLPPIALKDLNIEEELLLQFHQLRRLQGDVLNDESLPLNQRAQVASTVAASLHKLSERQEAIWSSERFKDIENLLIRTLSQLPEDLAASFLDTYEKIIHRQ